LLDFSVVAEPGVVAAVVDVASGEATFPSEEESRSGPAPCGAWAAESSRALGTEGRGTFTAGGGLGGEGIASGAGGTDTGGVFTDTGGVFTGSCGVLTGGDGTGGTTELVTPD
jgi:hypothetical protein